MKAVTNKICYILIPDWVADQVLLLWVDSKYSIALKSLNPHPHSFIWLNVVAESAIIFFKIQLNIFISFQYRHAVFKNVEGRRQQYIVQPIKSDEMTWTISVNFLNQLLLWSPLSDRHSL